MNSPSAAKRGERANVGATRIVVVAALVLSLSMGLRQSLGLFLNPITLETGVSAATFGLAMATQNLVWGISQPFLGMMGDRFGPRPVLIGSGLVYAAGLAIMALCGPLVGLNIGGGVLEGVGVAGTGFGVLLGAAARAAPPSRRSQTVGMVSAAGSLATLVIAPLGQQLMSSLGWRQALLGFALIALAMTAVSLLIGGRPQATNASGDPARVEARKMIVEAMSHRGYCAMTVAFFACGFQLMFITTHLPSYLALCGVPLSVGATALGLIGLGNAVGSYVVGQLGARYSQKRLLALIYLLRTGVITVFLLVPISPTTVLVFAAAMGLLWLSVAPLVSGLIGRMFGLANFNTLFGLAFFSHQLGGFAGAWLGGLSLDRFGSYGPAWISLILIGSAAFAVQWFMDDEPRAAGSLSARTMGQVVQA